MRMQKETVTTREFEATEIPSGMKIRIPEGTNVAITQSLGGSYTIMTPYGYMARVDGKDADAIGEETTPYLIRNSSSDRPFAVSAASHFGCWPRPAHVWDGSAGLRYFGGTLPVGLPLAPLFFAGAFSGFAWAEPAPNSSATV